MRSPRREHRCEGGRGEPQGSRRDPGARARRPRRSGTTRRRSRGRAPRRRRGSPSATAAHPIAAHLKRPLDAARSGAARHAVAASPTTQPGEVGDKGFGPTFPHDVAADEGSGARDLTATPLGNELVLDTAVAAIDGEQLGADARPGPARRQPVRARLRRPRLGPRVVGGVGHAAPARRAARPLPRRRSTIEGRRRPVGDDRHERSRRAARCPSAPAAGGSRYGTDQGRREPRRVDRARSRRVDRDVHYPTVYLDADGARARRRTRLARTPCRRSSFALRSFPGLARVELTSDLAGHCERAHRRRVRDLPRRSIRARPARSSSCRARGWIAPDARRDPHATAHGSLYDYDREVPLIMLPPGPVRPHAPRAARRARAGEIYMVRIATVLARWLGVTPPSTLPR